MSLGSALMGPGSSSADGPSDSVELGEMLSVDDASKALLRAVKANDVDGITNALRLAYAACQSEYEVAGTDDG